MTKPLIVVIAVLSFIILILAVSNKSLKTNLEKANLYLEKLRTELAMSKQSGLMCEEKVILQNDSIQAYMVDMKTRREELNKKNKELSKKYEALKSFKPPETCGEVVKLIDKQQESFLE